MKNFITFLLLVCTTQCFSNGGTYDHSHFRKTGNIRLMQKADVKLLREDLKITIKGDYSLVEVKYTLQNNGEDQKIYYGFPVDAWGMDVCFGMPCGPPFRFIEWEGSIVCVDSIVNEFRISVNGNKISHSNWVEDTSYYIKSEKTWKDSINIARKWHQVFFEMKKGEKTELSVYYKIKNGFHDNSPGFVSTPVFDDRNFTYHMTPSGNWGNGIVDEFNVTIETENISDSACEMKMEGLQDLKKSGNTYIGNYKNFNLSKSDRINISYRQDFRLWSKFVSNNTMNNSYIKNYTTNSSDQNLKNLFDKDPTTVWRGKVGDYIVIYFDTTNIRKIRGTFVEGGKTYNSYYYEKPEAVLALNGNFSSKDAFTKSSKVRITKINVNDSGFVNSEPWDNDSGKRYFYIPEKKYSGLLDVFPMGDVSVFGDGFAFYDNGHDFSAPLKIKIYFSDIYKGEEEEFTISEMIFTR